MNFGEKVSGEKRIYFFNGVNDAAVYVGSLRGLHYVKVEPRDDWVEIDGIRTGDNFPYLTLDEIKEQVTKNHNHSRSIITVYQDDPMHGELYQYGNYGDFWVYFGETGGYA